MFETLQKYMTEGDKVRLNEIPLEAPKEPKAEKRRYNSARYDRTSSDWVSSSLTQNMILRGDLRRLRQRSRDLAKNDPYAKKFLSLTRNNVIGKGMTLQIRPVGKQMVGDSDLSSYIETKWAEWCKKEYCSVSGKLSFRKAQRLAVTQLARDGEVLVRKIYGKNKFGFSIKLYSADWLDETYNDTLNNGNRVIMSVEVDDYDKPVAYFLTQPAGDYQRRNTTRYRVRVPAEEIIHFYLINEDEEQTRDAPWLHASMVRLNHFDKYEEAELVGKRIEACQMGFVIPPPDEGVEAEPDDEDKRKESAIIDAEPGMFQRLEPGFDVKTFTPKMDGGANDFKKTALRGVAAGADISYHSLASDLEGVNYSSARIGTLEDRDSFESIQQDMIEDFCEPIYKAWLESAFLSGELNISLKNYERVKEPVFRARGWKWVDPKNDTEASVLAYDNKITTLTDILAEKGIDLEDHFTTLQKEKELADKFGIEISPAKTEPVQNNP